MLGIWRIGGFILFMSLLHQSLKLLKCFMPPLQPVNTEPYVHLCFVACKSVECFFLVVVWIHKDTLLSAG